MREFDSLCLYICVYLISAICLGYWGKTNNKFLAVIGFIPPILLAAFRFPVGTDFWLYLVFFNRDTSRTFEDIFSEFYSEGGFHSVAKIAGTIGDESLYFGACAFLTLVPVVLTFKKQGRGKEMFLFSIIFLLTTFTTSLNIMRQGIAIAFTFVASQYIFKRDPLRFGLWIVVAMMFHLSAAIFAPAYFLYTKDKLIDFKRGVIIVVVIIGVTYASSLIESLSKVEGFDKYTVYSDGDDRAQNRSIILSFFLLALYLLRAKKMQALDGSAYTYLIMFIVSVIIETTGTFTPFIKRSGLYFSIYNIVLACQWVKTFDIRSKALARIFMVAFFIARFTVAFYLLGQSNIIPYNTKETYRISQYG